jgi:hypothetical protein
VFSSCFITAQALQISAWVTAVPGFLHRAARRRKRAPNGVEERPAGQADSITAARNCARPAFASQCSR